MRSRRAAAGSLGSRALAGLLATIVLGPAMVVPASATIAPERRAADAVAPAMDSVREVRASLSGGVASALGAITGRPVETLHPDASAPLPGELAARIARLPASLSAPLAELSAGVSAASRTVLDALRRLGPGRAREAAKLLAGVDVNDAARTGRTAPALATLLPDLDRGAIETAALRLAATLDRTLPSLRVAAGPIPARPPRSEPPACDVLDASPALCVGGRGPNRYTADTGLLVDLGGEDVYENAAGGVNPADASVGGLPVAVVLDLGGDDVYERAIAQNRPQPAQGGAVAGIGMLVDVSGNDRYVARVVVPDGAPKVAAFARAQGAGALGGVGVLADLSGNDEHVIDASAATGRTAFGYGQGYGIAGAGLLLDAGPGDDTYTMTGGVAGVDTEATPPAGQTREVAGQGLGALEGSGALVDGGGRDELSLSAQAAEAGGYPGYAALPYQAPSAQAYGQGMGTLDASTGLLLLGAGATSYAITTAGTGLADVGVAGQGFGLSGATGILDDLGGNDTYLLASSLSASMIVSAGAGCGCTEVAASLSGERGVVPEDVVGQGYAYEGLATQHGYGVLADHGGDDGYTARHEGSIEAAAVAEAPGILARANAVSFPPVNFNVQGVAGSKGVGVLLDEGGNDTYEASMLHIARARASAPSAEDASATAVAQLRSSIQAQGVSTSGGSLGALADLGGRDRYLAVARTEADASPTPGGAWELGGVGWFQGAGSGGLLVDSDSGEEDAFASETNLADTCVGSRGESPGWQGGGCGTATGSATGRPGGAGVVDSARAKTAPLVAFADGQPASGKPEALLEIAGRITEPGGAGVGGAFVDLRLQYFALTLLPGTAAQQGVWADLRAVHAVTAADGSWSATMRLPDEAALDRPAGLRLWAIYSGSEALRAVSSSIPFTPVLSAGVLPDGRDQTEPLRGQSKLRYYP